MPIKLKCSCGQVLSIPDKMAGKTGKCPKCKKEIKVPTPKQKAAHKQKAAPKPQSAGVAGGAQAGGGLDSLFEEAGLTQKTGPTCPQCMAEVKPGTVLCTSCGFHLESGERLTGADVQVQGPEFDNMYLQEAAENMRRDLVMDDRREKAAMPWWVIMSFLIGAVTLCAAGVVIVDGKFGTPASPASFVGKVQRWPVYTTLGLTASITGTAIIFFAHLNICIFGFTRSVVQGLACFFLPLVYSLIYGIMNWTDNKAPVKAVIMALCFVGLGVFLIVQGGGFQLVLDAFK